MKCPICKGLKTIDIFKGQCKIKCETCSYTGKIRLINWIKYKLGIKK